MKRHIELGRIMKPLGDIPVLLVTVMNGDIEKYGIKCEKCGEKWFDHYLLIDNKPYCADCADSILAKLFEE